MKNRETVPEQMTMLVLPEYRKQKLIDYAESYRSIAKVFLNFQDRNYKDSAASRQSLLYHRQAYENSSFVAEQFLDIADRISQIASEAHDYTSPDLKQVKQLYHFLKKEGVELKNIYYIDHESKDGALELTMRTNAKKERIPVSDIVDLLEQYYNMRICASVRNEYFIEQEFKSYIFMKEPPYCVLSGQASAVKNGEEITGDNVSVFEGIDGHIYFMLADGVGSGKEASRNSEKVLDFIEKFLSAGYSKETAVQTLNGLILQSGEEEAMSTLDICDMNLYKGVCEFNKIGSSVSFHKRDYLVEKIWMENLPLGAFGTLNLDVVRRKLEEGDYIIMITDGILDGVISEGREEKLTEFISKLAVRNPRDMAQQILKYCIELCGGEIVDDMTVLVFGMWKS